MPASLSRSSVVLASALAASLLVNGVAFLRLVASDAPARQAPPAPADSPEAAPPGPEPDSRDEEIARLSRELATLRFAPSPAPPPSTPPTPPSAPARSGPYWTKEIEEQARADVFWNRLAQISRVGRQMGRDLDEHQHELAVLEATADYLGLPEAARPAFNDTIRAATHEMDAAFRVAKDVYDADSNVQDYRRRMEQARKDLFAAPLQRWLDPTNAQHVRLLGQIDPWTSYVGRGRWSFSPGVERSKAAGIRPDPALPGESESRVRPFKFPRDMNSRFR